MTAHKVLTSMVSRLRHPNITVRWRLAVLYGALFFASGVALLAITYALVDHATVNQPSIKVGRDAPARLPVSGRSPAPRHQASQVAVPPSVKHLLRSRAGRQVVTLVGSQQRISDLHQLEVESAIALAIMALVSGGWDGWSPAECSRRCARSPRPRDQISETNLHERLAMAGPRDELRQLADTIDGLLERLRAAFDAQRRFVANASHELRTPLAMMRTTLDVAVGQARGRTAADPRARRRPARRPRPRRPAAGELPGARPRSARRAGRAAARSRSSSSSPPRSRPAPRQIAAKQIERTHSPHPGRVDRQRDVAGEVGRERDRERRPPQPPHGSIEVTCSARRRRRAADGRQQRSVLDQDAVAQLAQPFRRLGQDRTGSHNGHGLGLSIVAAVAAAHDGTLELHARPHGGLRVEITLPGRDARPTPGTRCR